MAPDPAWLRDLQPASFGGVGFGVTSHTRTGGTRGPDHEYPDRDLGDVETLGAATQVYAFDAYLIGDDYHEQVERLIAVLEAGVAELIHPRWGALRAVCRSYTEAETYTEGGIARLSLSFTRDGGAGPVVSLASTLELEADELRATAADALEARFDPTGSGVVADAALATVTSTIQRVRDAARGPLVEAIADAEALNGALRVSAATLLSPRELAAWAETAFSALGDLEGLDAFTRERAAPRVTTSTDPTEQAIARNDNAVAAYMQRCALAAQAEIAVEQIGNSVDVRDDAIALRDRLAERLETEEGGDPTAAEYRALCELRTGMHARITAAAAPLVQLVTIETTALTSTLELAWDLYGDASRADEIHSRNRAAIRHPGFVQPGSYVVKAQ